MSVTVLPTRITLSKLAHFLTEQEYERAGLNPLGDGDFANRVNQNLETLRDTIDTDADGYTVRVHIEYTAG